MYVNQPTFQEFNCNASNQSAEWEEWKERLEMGFGASEIAASKGQRRHDMLFFYGGAELLRIHKTVPVDVPEKDDLGETRTVYDKAIYRLDAYFKPKKNLVVEEYKFGAAVQHSDETIARYVTRLRILAAHCGFADLDKRIVSQVIEKCHSSALRRTFLKQDEIDITKLLKLGAIHDTLERDMETVEGRRELENRVDYVNRGMECFGCGDAYPQPGVKESCPAANKECRGCGKRGHFVGLCKSRDAGASRVVVPNEDMINQIELAQKEQRDRSQQEDEPLYVF
jgi:hypothetical protein